MTRVIKAADFVQSVTDALQFISYTHPPDFIALLTAAWRRERSPEAKAAMAQILVNSRLAFLGRRPMCQDTGIVNVFLKVGTGVRWEGDISPSALVDDAVRLAYANERNPLRPSMVVEPLGARRNSGDNTPAVVMSELVDGDRLEIDVAAKGAGSENKARFAVLLPGDNPAQWVEQTVATMGAGWCPPGILGIGIGGTAEKSMLMAKQALLEPLDMQLLLERGPADDIDRLRLDIYHRVNALGIGAQGLGGITTVLDVKVKTFPTHAASLPISLIPNCAATRHVRFELDGSGPAAFQPPPHDHWPDVVLEKLAGSARAVNLDALDQVQVCSWRAGETLLLTGRLITGRDAAHRRMARLLAQGCDLPVRLQDRVLYYVGPVAAVGDEVIGPAGPTTADRMDGFLDELLGRAGLLATIGKAERGPAGMEAMRKHRRPYLIAVGGAALLISQSIRSSRVVAFDDLGMEAMCEFEVADMPVVVAVDCDGRSIHVEGPRRWRSDPLATILPRINLQ